MIAEEFLNRLPPLQTGDDVLSEAVRSVARRGFHDETPALARDPRLMAEFLRLAEEFGEYSTATPGDVMSEAADVVIVCAQIVWLLETDVGDSITDFYDVKPVENKLLMLGELSRTLRTGSRGGAVFWLRAIMYTFYQEFGEGKLNDAIRQKLVADEQRGRLHSGEPLTNVAAGEVLGQ